MVNWRCSLEGEGGGGGVLEEGLDGWWFSVDILALIVGTKVIN